MKDAIVYFRDISTLTEIISATAEYYEIIVHTNLRFIGQSKHLKETVMFLTVYLSATYFKQVFLRLVNIEIIY